jgi:hypothetical protein
MSDGLVRLAEYGDEYTAMDAVQYLVDNGIEAKMFGSVTLYFPRFDLQVPASQAERAQALLRDFDNALKQAADEQAEQEPAEGDDEHPEADCEGKS